MAVSDGQAVDASVTNAAFLSRTVDSDTVGKVGLANTDGVSGSAIANAQRYINEIADADGTSGEGDSTRKNYSSNNYVANGDDRKVAIGKLDTQMATNASNISTNASNITTNANNLTTHMADTTTHGTTGDIVGTSDTQTLTNKTLTTPNINGATPLTATSIELNQLDGVSVGGSSAGDIATIDDAQTLTNKVINVDNNTLSNIEVDNFKTGVLDTDLSSVSASDDTIPSAKATKAYVDAQIVGSGSNQSVQWTGGFSTSVGSSAMTINLKQQDGSTDPTSGSPVLIAFRDATVTDGSYDVITITSSASVTIPSGATLGHVSGKDNTVYIYALNNSGTVELAVSSYLFDDSKLESTTALSAASDSSTILYSTTARSSVPIRCIGYLTSNQTVSGTYASNASHLSNRPISAIKRVLVRAAANGETIPASPDYIIYGTETIDNTGSYDNTTGIFTVPRDGDAEVTASLQTANYRNQLFIIIYLDSGSGYSTYSKRTIELTSGDNATLAVEINDLLCDLKKDYKIRIGGYANSADTTPATTTDCILTIKMD